MEQPFSTRPLEISRHAADRLAERFGVRANLRQAVDQALRTATWRGWGDAPHTAVYASASAWFVLANEKHRDVLVTVLPLEWPLRVTAPCGTAAPASDRASGSQIEALARTLGTRGVRVRRTARHLGLAATG